MLETIGRKSDVELLAKLKKEVIAPNFQTPMERSGALFRFLIDTPVRPPGVAKTSKWTNKELGRKLSRTNKTIENWWIGKKAPSKAEHFLLIFVGQKNKKQSKHRQELSRRIEEIWSLAREYQLAQSRLKRAVSRAKVISSARTSSNEHSGSLGPATEQSNASKEYAALPLLVAAADGRLSEQLSDLRNETDAAKFLASKPHRLGWSLAFKDSLSVLSADKREELASLFYGVVGACWDKSDPTSAHAMTMAAGTLTYIASHIDGLKQVGLWDKNLTAMIPKLSPEKVLLAEPLSYVACVHGKDASFFKNIERTIIDPLYREVDFNERLRYSGDGKSDLAGIVSVAKNVATHLHNRPSSQIIAHDVGRVIKVYPTLIKYSGLSDLAQSLKFATINALQDISIERKLVGLVEDVMEGRKVYR